MSTATDMRDAYLAAELAVLAGQSYRLGERQLTLANLPEIQAGRQEWERRVAAETASVRGDCGFAVADFSGRCR
ncbi:MAG: primosomal replication protein PriB/PriC domain protein [Dokdonella sp.]|uniref:primosomal replication protein PriB/PriC domain protein n=1 Tax=Dokdonella sp. TaxID=2291710 RepID=UPI003F80CE04